MHTSTPINLVLLLAYHFRKKKIFFLESLLFFPPSNTLLTFLPIRFNLSSRHRSTSLDASSAYCVTDSTDSGLGLLSCRGAENQNVSSFFIFVCLTSIKANFLAILCLFYSQYEFLCPSCGGGGPQFGTSCLVKLVEADLCITGNKSGEELNLTKCDFSFSDATQVS